jgi:hypothetical protein
MSSIGVAAVSDSKLTPPAAERGFFWNFVIETAPYIAFLILVLVGVAYTSVNRVASILYWQAVVPGFAVICIITGWSHVEPDRRSRIRLIRTQVLHWGAVFLVMRLVFVHDVQRMLDSDITGLVLLDLLALGTFLAGLYLNDWRLGVLGVFLGVASVAIAFLDTAAFSMLILAIFILLVFALWRWYVTKSPSQ